MAVRSSPYRMPEIIKLLEAAGWEARQSGTHTILNKLGRRTITLSDPVHKNNIALIQQELGMHILEMLPRSKGRRPSRQELIKRIEMAKRMLSAGLNSTYVVNKAGLGSLSRAGIRVSELQERPAEELADRVYQSSMKAKGVTIRPAPAPAAAVPKPRGDDVSAMLDLLGPISQHLEMITRTDRLSLLGGYLELLRLSLADLNALKPTLERSLEITNRMIARLEKVG